MKTDKITGLESLTKEELCQLAQETSEWKNGKNYNDFDGQYLGVNLCFSKCINDGTYYLIEKFNGLKIGELQGRYTLEFDTRHSAYIDIPQDPIAERLIPLYRHASFRTDNYSEDDNDKQRKISETEEYLKTFLRPFLQKQKTQGEK